MKKRVELIVVLISVIILLLGCVSDNSISIKNKEFTIGVVTKAKDSEYWMSYISGINKAAVDFDVNVILLSPQTETETEVQCQMITDMLDKEIDAIAISPIDSHEMSVLKYAEEKGIPVYATDSAYFSTEIPYIGYDNKKMGEDLAAITNRYLEGHGSVGVISGSLSQAGHRERVEGFCEYLAKYSSIRTAFVIDGYSNLLLPEAEIKDLLEKNPDLGVIFVTNAVAALGLADYLATQESEIQICAMDAQQDAYEAVKNGRIMALANHSGYENGYQTIRRITEAIRENKELDETMLNAEILTKKNIYSYDLQVE